MSTGNPTQISGPASSVPSTAAMDQKWTTQRFFATDYPGGQTTIPASKLAKGFVFIATDGSVLQYTGDGTTNVSGDWTSEVDFATQAELASEAAARAAADTSTLNSAKAYTDAAVIGSLRIRSTSYDASTGLFPATGGSGTAGAIQEGDTWIIGTAGTLGTIGYSIGDAVVALVNTPGQTAANWDRLISSSVASRITNDSSVSGSTVKDALNTLLTALSLKALNALSAWTSTAWAAITNSDTVVTFTNKVGTALNTIMGSGTDAYVLTRVGGATVWAAPAASGLATSGASYVIPAVTSSAATNGANFLAAYAAAAALTPNGSALSATNRACVILLPGVYSWSGNFTTQNYVDVAGISGNRADVQLTGAWAGGSNPASEAGFANVTATANYAFGGNATISGIYNNCASIGNNTFGSAGPCSGTFTNCDAAGTYSFGGDGGTCSGRFINCNAGGHAFGGNSGVFSGYARDCSAGDLSFGALTTFSGTAINCTAGDRSFGGQGTFSGTVINCSTNGTNGSFGGAGGVFSGNPRLTNCVGEATSFALTGGTTALMQGCRLLSGSFGLYVTQTQIHVRRCVNADLSEANAN